MPFAPPSPDTLVEEDQPQGAFTPPSPDTLVEEAPSAGSSLRLPPAPAAPPLGVWGPAPGGELPPTDYIKQLTDVSKAIPADVAAGMYSLKAGLPEASKFSGNLPAALRGEPLPISKTLSDVSAEAPISATVGKLSQDIASTAPMLAIGGLPGAVQKAAMLAFTAKMVSDAPDVAKQLGDEFGKPADHRDMDKITSLISQGIQITGFSAAGALGLKRGLEPSAERPRVTSGALQGPTAAGELLRQPPGAPAPPSAAPVGPETVSPSESLRRADEMTRAATLSGVESLPKAPRATVPVGPEEPPPTAPTPAPAKEIATWDDAVADLQSRGKGQETKAQIQSMFPGLKLGNETAARLAKAAFGDEWKPGGQEPQKAPAPASPEDISKSLGLRFDKGALGNKYWSFTAFDEGGKQATTFSVKPGASEADVRAAYEAKRAEYGEGEADKPRAPKPRDVTGGKDFLFMSPEEIATWKKDKYDPAKMQELAATVKPDEVPAMAEERDRLRKEIGEINTQMEPVWDASKAATDPAEKEKLFNQANDFMKKQGLLQLKAQTLNEMIEHAPGGIASPAAAPAAPAAEPQWMGLPLSHWKELASKQLPRSDMRTRLAKSLGVADEPKAVAAKLKARIAEIEESAKPKEAATPITSPSAEPVPPVVRDIAPGSIAPQDIRPSIRLVGGKVVPGKLGDTHDDIIDREKIDAKDIDQRGFSDPEGKKFFLDREAAAKGTGTEAKFEPGGSGQAPRLHSTDLNKAKPAVEAAPAAAKANVSISSPSNEAAKMHKGAAKAEAQVPPTEKAALEAPPAAPEATAPAPKPDVSVHQQPPPGPEPPLGGTQFHSGIPMPDIALESVSLPTEESLKALPTSIRNAWRSFSMQTLPKITASDRETGEAGARSIAAPQVGRTKGIIFAERVLEGSKDKKADFKLGTALTEDNRRDLLRQHQARAADPSLTPEERAQAAIDAGKVGTAIGAPNSPFKTETEYQAYLASPEAQTSIARHIALWESEKDPIFREANDLAPEAELETRGLQTGARVNLKAVLPDEPATKTTVGPAAVRSTLVRQSATLLRKDPFARQAKGTGQSYEGSYTELMANGFGREYPIAKYHEFVRSLIEAGDAKRTSSEKPIELKGEPTKPELVKLRGWGNQWLQIRKSLADEFESATGLKPATRLGIYSKAADVMTKQSIMGLAEGSTHIGNLGMQIFSGLGPTGNPMLNALIKSVGRADVLYALPKVLIKGFTDQHEAMLKLAEIGAAKEPYRGNVGWFITRIDQGIRLYSADIYKKMAAQGWVPKTETGLREFVNQVGQYNKRAQPGWIRVLRDTGIQPFATAMQTFNVQGLRTLGLGPGAKGIAGGERTVTIPGRTGTTTIKTGGHSATTAALALRADKAAGILGFMALVTSINYLLSGTATGPPGTKLGAVGWVGDDKKVHQLDLGMITGMTRGLRITGLQGAIEARRLGLSPNAALAAGVEGAANTAISAATGPMNRFAFMAATGKRPGFPPVQEAKVVPPTDDLAPLKSQVASNIKQAIQESNPAMDFMARMAQVKTAEAFTRQFTRYMPKTGLSTETIQALPKIVNAGELRNYADAVSKDARKLPMDQRMAFVQKQLADDGVTGANRAKAIREIEQRGTFKYK